VPRSTVQEGPQTGGTHATQEKASAETSKTSGGWSDKERRICYEPGVLARPPAQRPDRADWHHRAGGDRPGCGAGTPLLEKQLCTREELVRAGEFVRILES